jgi:hypothetical protein
MSSSVRVMLSVVAVAMVIALAAPAPANAGFTSTVCGVASFISGGIGKLCDVATHAGRVLKAGKSLLGGHLGGAIDALTGSGAKKVLGAAVGLTAITLAVVHGAKYLLGATAHVIGLTTRPNLSSTWFSGPYWRMAAVSALLTLPFLFAAAVQALLRSDLALLLRAAFGYLPLGMLAVGIAAPVTMLLLAGSDELSAIVSSASGGASAGFLTQAGVSLGLVSAVSGPFVAFFAALLTAAATIVLWIELLIREAAIYVVVLMLPLFFAALVWPARRVWAIRAVELLVALILSKFAIVAVLALGGAALGHDFSSGPAALLVGLTLVLLASASPWALLRLLPLHELAGAAVGGLRAHPQGAIGGSGPRAAAAESAAELAAEVPARMRDSSHPIARQLDDDEPVAEGAPAPDPRPGGPLTTGAGPAAPDPEPGGPPTTGAAAPAPEPGPGGFVATAAAPGAGAGAPGGSTGAPGAGPGAPGGSRASVLDPGGETADPLPAGRDERPPLPQIFSAPSGTWRPLALGPEEFESDRPLVPDPDLPDPDPGPSSSDAPQTPVAGPTEPPLP